MRRQQDVDDHPTFRRSAAPSGAHRALPLHRPAFTAFGLNVALVNYPLCPTVSRPADGESRSPILPKAQTYPPSFEFKVPSNPVPHSIKEMSQ
jgi:hypothetical protein